jgi:hypothetical protein
MGLSWTRLLGTLTLVLGTSMLVSHPVAADDPVATTTSLEVRGGGLYGDELVLAATVTSDSGTPTGSVQFYDSGDPMGAPVPLGADGTALHTSAAVAGLHSYRAVFVGIGGFAGSEATQFHVTIASALVLHAEPTILAPGLRPTLTLSAYAEDTRGRPVVGETLTLSVLGDPPNPFDFGGGKVVCNAVTDERGFASCRGRGLVASVLTLLGAPSYVSHSRTSNYGFGVATAPVIRLK